MRKSKYLILGPLYLEFKEDLSIIIGIKKQFDMQNILDLLRYDNVSNIPPKSFWYRSLNFIFLPDTICDIDEFAFEVNHIYYVNFSNCKSLNRIDFESFDSNNLRILDLSNCAQLKYVESESFIKNKIKFLKLPDELLNIKIKAFEDNEIINLQLLNCKKYIIIYE